MQYKVKRIDSLTHHGILGMKWGKQNGPPYPLSPGQHSASEKKAGWQKSLNKKGTTSNTPMASGGGAGGGGKVIEEDQKILNELYDVLEERAKELGMTPMEMLNSQNFGLTLAEETGYGDGLSDADLERLRKKAFEHYSTSKADLIKNTAKYAKEEKALRDEQAFKEYQKWEEEDLKKRDLKHYGILGQKWGKRNGPPYPLSGAAKSLAERRAGRKSEALKKAKKTNINSLSDNDLNRINNRLRSEQEFKRLTQTGNKKAKELLFDLGAVAVSGGLLYASVRTGNDYAATIAKATLAASVVETAKDSLGGSASNIVKQAVDKSRGR